MAVSSVPPPPLDPEVEERGQVVFHTKLKDRKMIQVWVERLAQASGQKVDWHFLGPSVCVLAAGDLGKVKLAIVQLIQEHDDCYMKELRSDPVGKYLPDAFVTLPRPEWWAQYVNATTLLEEAFTGAKPKPNPGGDA
jgi:hypothetical protein